jgi:hypothetical protein
MILLFYIKANLTPFSIIRSITKYYYGNKN